MSLPRAATLSASGLQELRMALLPASRRAPGTIKLRIQAYHCAARSPFTASITFHTRQRRWQTSKSSSRPGQQEQQEQQGQQNENEPPRPKPTVAQILRAIFRGSFKNLRDSFRGPNLRAAYRQAPEEFVLAVTILVGLVGVMGYIVHMYFNYFYSDTFTRYPEDVAQSLRRALYFSNMSPDPPRALKYWKKAIEQCEEHRLDYFSDEVIGLKIMLSQWLVESYNFNAAIKVLETVLKDCKRWVDVMEKSVADGTAPKILRPPPVDKDGNPVDIEEEVETIWGKRTRVLGKAVQISNKLGELYADEHVLEPETAHEHLAWGVSTALAELRRRTVEGLKEGEGHWMNAQEIGGALEAFAHSFETRSQFDLALPLFFQALKLCEDPCHSAVLMNNLAISYAQHPARAVESTLLEDAPKDLKSPNAPYSRVTHLESARRWASNAYQHATETKGEARTPECDEACAVALCNLGDIASLLADFPEARKRFEQALDVSQKLNYAPGVVQAREGLRRLERPVKMPGKRVSSTS